MNTFVYKPKGVCSTEMQFQLEGDVITGLQVINGCNGNLKGISALVKGRTIDEVIGCLDGIKCGFKTTSCPDQIAQALKAYKTQQ